MADSRTKIITIGGGLGAVALAVILFVVYSGGSEQSGPSTRTEASLDNPQDEFSENDRVAPTRESGARTGDETRSRLAGGSDEGSADAAADEDKPQAKKKTKRNAKKRGRKTSGGEEEEEEQATNQRRLPKPTNSMLEGP